MKNKTNKFKLNNKIINYLKPNIKLERHLLLDDFTNTIFNDSDEYNEQIVRELFNNGYLTNINDFANIINDNGDIEIIIDILNKIIDYNYDYDNDDFYYVLSLLNTFFTKKSTKLYNKYSKKFYTIDINDYILNGYIDYQEFKNSYQKIADKYLNKLIEYNVNNIDYQKFKNGYQKIADKYLNKLIEYNIDYIDYQEFKNSYQKIADKYLNKLIEYNVNNIINKKNN